MTTELERSIARIVCGSEIAGVGFLVDEGRILTCAHVVRDALGLADGADVPPDAVLEVQFVLVPGSPSSTATVERFHPDDATGDLDVSVLRLRDGLPAAVHGVPLGRDDALWGDEFAAFGFPAGYDEGTWVSGRFRGRQASGWVQVEDVKETGYLLQRGYSGGPAWNASTGAVVGMVVAADSDRGPKAGWIIPTARLLEACADLPVQDRAVTGANRDRFVSLLSRASSVTLIGFTHERLIDYLEEAFQLRAARGDPVRPWEEVRVVFLDETLLHAVDDELEVSRQEAAAIRKDRARAARHMIRGFFISGGHADHWEFREYEYLLPFVGAMFVLDVETTVVQLAPLRPGRPVSKYLFSELVPGHAQFEAYRAAIDRVCEQAHVIDEVVLVGEPLDSREGGPFLCRGFVPRRQVLRGSGDPDSWVAAIVVALWHRAAQGAVPLLGVKTRSNATRELGTVSHLSGYINDCDCREGADRTAPFVVGPEIARAAAEREISEELGIGIDAADLELVAEHRFYNGDLENLYFHVLSLEVDELTRYQFRKTAGIRPWSLDELLAVRESQVLATVSTVLESGASTPGRRRALALLADNLVLHRRRDLAAAVRRAARGHLDGLAEKVAEMVSAGAVHVRVNGREQIATGLAGLQHREFFTTLLPLYARIGVPGAAARLDQLRASQQQSAALARLRDFYADAGAMRAVGCEGL